MSGEERLHKIIARSGLASRRKAEDLIRAGRVTVDGRVITELGSKADPSRSHVKVDGKLIRRLPPKIYVLLNKPRRVITSVVDPQGRTKVTDLVDVKERIYPVGRLDYHTEGLILLTNDGEFSRIAGSAGTHLPKVYYVKVRSVPDEAGLARLRAGIRLREGTQLAPCQIRMLRKGNNSWLEVTLNEGKNLQIRRMFESIGHPVLKLRRKRIGFLTDAGLELGQYRFLTRREVERILRLGRDRQTQKP